MEMRDRLIWLIKQATTSHLDYLESIDQKGLTDTDGRAKFIADHLLANGGIVPPCKVGQTVYIDSDTWGFDYLYFESKFIHSKHFLIGEIVSIIKTKKQLLMKIRVSNSIHTRYKHRRYTVNALGVTVFFTKEEAEKALKERCGK